MIKRKFFNTVATACALASIIADPAFAGDSFEVMSYLKSTAYKAEQDAINNSKDKVIVVSYGSSSSFAKAAGRGALQAYKEGIPIAYYIAPDSNKDPQDAEVKTYYNGNVAKGVDLVVRYGLIDDSAVTRNNVSDGVYTQAKATYEVRELNTHVRPAPPSQQL